MRQAVLEGIRRVSQRRVPAPHPGPGDVLVRVAVALTCGTDLKLFRRPHARLRLPLPFGHEASGVVAASGEGASFRPGQAVMWVHTAPDGTCEMCRRGRENLCETLLDGAAWGAYADEVLLPARVASRHLFEKPEELPFEEAAMLEPLSCVVHAWDRLGPGPVDSVAVLGLGAMGLLHVALARRRGAGRIMAVGTGIGAALARQMGATEVVEGRVESVAAGARDVLGGGAETVVECTGSAAVWALAPTFARRGGRVMLYGGLQPGVAVDVHAERVHYDEVTLLGSFHYRPADVLAAREILVRREIPVGLLVTGRARLDDLEQAFADLDARRHLKLAIVPGQAA